MTPPLPRLFLHFFDTHFLEEVATGVPAGMVAAEADAALRLAIIAAELVFLPAASYYESSLCRTLLTPLADIFDRGVIRITGSAAAAAEFAESKLLQYPPESPQGKRYAAVIANPELAPPYRARSRSATADLTDRWRHLPNQPDFEANLYRGLVAQPPLSLADDWLEVPDLLAGRAFTPQFVLSVLFNGPPPPVVGMRVSTIINGGYFESFSGDLQAGQVTDLVYLNSGHRVRGLGIDLPYLACWNALRASGLHNRVLQASAVELLDLRDNPEVAQALLTGLGPMPTRHIQPRLWVAQPDELRAQLAAVRRTSTGKGAASSYQKRVTALIDMLFAGQLGQGMLETEINQGRKRIDVVFPNLATEGFFGWAASRWGATMIYAEAKNYRDDAANPELDQLLGRFSSYGVQFGLLLCRSLKNPQLFWRRCNDAVRAGRGLVLPITDDDLHAIVELSLSGGQGSVSGWLYRRAMDVERA